ncbi:MAG: hypothetical protein N2C14_34090, partial [Planctomycetales bacterium]
KDAPLSPAEINVELLKRDILGGIDLTGQLDGFERCMLICVTEIHSADDMERFAGAMSEILAVGADKDPGS